MFDGSRDIGEIIEDVARLGARLIIQTAVEAEVDVFLGRARYQRAADVPDARAGSRNGFYDSTVKTTARPVTVARPKVRGTTEAFASQLFGMPIDVLKAEQTRLTAELARVEASLANVERDWGQVDENLSRALNYLTNCFDLYATGSTLVRRRLNQALFERFEVNEDDTVTGMVAEPFRALLAVDAGVRRLHPGERIPK